MLSKPLTIDEGAVSPVTVGSVVPTDLPIGAVPERSVKWWRDLTIWEMIKHHSSIGPERKPAFTFYLGNGRHDYLSWGELASKAASLGSRLVQLNATSQRVVLLHNSTKEFVVSFAACLYAGAVAVPAYPISLLFRPKDSIERLRRVIDNCMPIAIVADHESRQRVLNATSAQDFWRRQRWILSEDVLEGTPGGVEPAVTKPDDVVLLQYTSGSTNNPMGVMLTNRNLTSNSWMIQQSHVHLRSSTIVTWTPVTHDWGLVNGVVVPIYTDANAVLLEPSLFVRDPSEWLRAIGAHRHVCSGAPNFAYELCVSRINVKDCQDIDLSVWERAGVGAEPIRAATLERFAKKFASLGFNSQSFYSAYGLAEATLMVSESGRSASPRVFHASSRALARGRVLPFIRGTRNQTQVATLVGCGKPPRYQEVVVVDPVSGVEVPMGHTGEIFVSGPNVAAGYWNDDVETKRVFHNRVEGRSGKFLRTGDLGAIVEGDLIVAGRLKEVVVVRGRNVYPSDVEHTVEEAGEGLASGDVMVFGLDTGRVEGLVVVVQVPAAMGAAERQMLANLVRRQVTAKHDVVPYDVVFVPRATLPKTPNRKAQRLKCRRAYIDKQLRMIEAYLLPEHSVRSSRSGTNNDRLES